MPKVTTTTSFSEDDQLTHVTLNSLFTNSAFHSSAVDDTTLELSSGAIRLKAAGGGNGIATSHINDDAIVVAKIADDAVETDQIKDANVTLAKMAVESVDSDQYVDGSIDEEHLSNDVITGQTALTAVPSLTDVMLFSDADDSGNLKKLDFMQYLPLPRAWGVINGNASPSTSDPVGLYGCTCTNYTKVGTYDYSYTFDLTTDMSSANYVVISSNQNEQYWSSAAATSAVEVVDAGQFRIHNAYATNTAYKWHFVVFGVLA